MKIDQRVIASYSKCDRLSYNESQTIKAIAQYVGWWACDRRSCGDSLKSQAIAPSMKVDEGAIAYLVRCVKRYSTNI